MSIPPDAQRLRLQHLGARVDLAVEPALAGWFAELFQALRVDDDATGRVDGELSVRARAGYTVVEDASGVHAAGTREAAAAHVLRGVHALTRARRTVDLLHAGGIAGPAGAVVLAGVSGAGKSTLVACAARAGAAHLADEQLAVHGDGHVLGSPAPVNIKAGGVGPLPWLGRPGPVDVARIGGRHRDGPVPVVAVVLLTARPGAGPVQVSRRDALLALARLTTPAEGCDDGALGSLAGAVHRATCVVLPRAAPDAMADVVLELAGLPAAPAGLRRPRPRRLPGAAGPRAGRPR